MAPLDTRPGRAAIDDGPPAPRRAAGGLEAVRARLERWRPVVLPALALWWLAAVVSAGFLHPSDVAEYQRYAHDALRAPVGHLLPQEYPPPALAVFLAPLLLPLSYPWAFAVVMGVALLVLVTSYERGAVPGWDPECARRLLVYLTVGSVMVLDGRYDVVAAAATLLSVRAARRERWSAAWTWSTLGFAVKLFPAALWPVLAVAEWRRCGRVPLRRLWWIGGALVVTVGVPALVAHGAALNVARYYLHRPTEMGSLSAGLSVLLDPHGTSWVNSFHSVNVVSGLTAHLSAALEVAALAGCLATWWAQARGRLPLEAACLTTLTLVVLGSKVLSVQYLMWLMPLWALYRLRVTWLAAAAANLVVFPYVASTQSFGYVPGHAVAVSLTLTFFARDVLMVAGTWAWLRTVARPTADPQGGASGAVEGAGGPGPPPGQGLTTGTWLVADIE